MEHYCMSITFKGNTITRGHFRNDYSCGLVLGRMHYGEGVYDRMLAVRGITVHRDPRTQTAVARSSGEAEKYGMSFGTTETMGVLHFLKEST